LLPEDPRLDRLFRIVTLEVGLAIGLIMAVAGAGGSVYAFLHWSLGSFGAEDLPRTLRIVVPSITLLILGVQVVLASFFLSGARRAASVPPRRGVEPARASREQPPFRDLDQCRHGRASPEGAAGHHCPSGASPTSPPRHQVRCERLRGDGRTIHPRLEYEG